MHECAEQYHTQIANQIDVLREKHASVTTVSLDELFGLLDFLMRFIEPRLILIDALDECSDDEEVTAKFLHDLVSRNYSGLQCTKFVFTSRTGTVSKDISVQTCYLRITASDTKEDIKAYVEQEVQRNGKLSPLGEKIVEVIVGNAQEMF